MSKGLEALERIGAEKLARGELIRNDNKVEPYYKTIEKELKALEIIKKKNVKTGLVCTLSSVEQYNDVYVYDNMLNVKWCLTEDEFNLLKGVLEDED